MAHLETLDRSEHTSTAEGVNGVQEQSSVQGSTAKSSEDDHPPVTKSEQLSSEPEPASSSPGSTGSVPLNGTTPNGVTPGAGTAPALSIPHPKKFAHSNINKKFLEKTSSASHTGSALSSTTTAKTGISNQKPVVQPTTPHSRLVTAKLTAGPQPSVLTGPGWSRPSSTGSNVAPTPSSTNPKPSPLMTPASTPSGPAGKVIHPAPRPAETLVGLRKDGGNKSAWGNSRLGGGSVDSVQNDFPTAAEVAQVRSAKLNEKKQAAQAAATQKQTLAAEADAFRGVHLGSGHHWDEDEGDDDNFLEGVIEFGDGRQYNIPTEPHQTSPSHDPSDHAPGREGAPTATDGKHDPVRKEDRFQDDFDRSWPPSRSSVAPPVREPPSTHRPPSSASSQPQHSPQEGSRVLFNERSNRLEPYSSQSHRFPNNREPYSSRRSDHGSSPTEPRRDLPPHTGSRGVQLLQKPLESPVEPSHRSRVFGDRPGFGNQNDRFRDNSHSRRDFPPTHGLKQPLSQNDSRTRDPHGVPHLSPVDSRTRRPSSGAESFPSPSEGFRAEGRPPPPHLSALHLPPAHRGPPSAAFSETNTGGPPSAHPVAHSPAASFASISPRAAKSPLQSSDLPLTDIDEVRKAAMHSAAERAKLRRQQEEEERERERERARRKAAELEAKMKAEAEAKAKAEQQTSEAQVIGIIESAVQSVSQGPSSNSLASVLESTGSPSAPISKPLFGRVPSTRGGIRPQPRRPSIPGPPPTQDVASPAQEADSWRSNAGPPKHFRRPSHPGASPLIPVVQPPPVVFQAAMQSFSINADEEVEIVDFADMGKLVGKPSESEPTIPEEPAHSQGSTRPPRPVATDFFEDGVTHTSGYPTTPSTEEVSWRRKTAATDDPSPPTDSEQPVSQSDPAKPDLHINVPPPHVHVSPHRRMSTASDDHSRPHGHGHPRSPMGSSYREAPMSALDDTMARIRGAMTGLQQKAEPAAPKPKWLPPALRVRSAAMHDDAPEEVFDVTAIEPPRSPKPAWNHFATKLPSVSRPRDPPTKRQLTLSKSLTHLRSDIFSWEPPIEGMNRKDFHLNDILFQRPFNYKGRPKYHVSLPRVRGGKPVVNLPPRPSVAPVNGAFGKKGEADEASSWRKPASPPKAPTTNDTEEVQEGLATTSRSPPPDAPSIATVSSAVRAEEVVSPTVSVASTGVRSRTQPKMPQGSDVAFYRDSRAESASVPSAAVKFIVSSELEDSISPSNSMNGTKPSTEVRVNGDIDSPATSRVVSAQMHAVSSPSSTSHLKLDSKKSEPVNDVPPSNPVSPWSSKSSPRVFSLKDSPSRPPDRDHLKAVWESTSNKADVSNSLERIGDDMPAVPFSILDVKSDGGETPPPPSSNPPSRMSQHDVTRAFQQVPTSTTNGTAPRRAAPAPTAPVPVHVVASQPSRGPQNHSMPPPQHIPNSGVRQMYGGYPSPLVSSPSPTIVYPMSMTPSPIPRPMVVNGTPQYPHQPMWVPMPGPPASTPNGMMRPPPPYGAQLMPYPHPPAGMYAPHGMQGNVPQPPPNGMQNRPPNGMQLMSPVMAPAHPHPHPHQHNGPHPHPHPHPHPVYAQSPILMHAPPAAGGHPVGHGYPNANQQPPRGQQMRGAYEHTAPGMMPYMPAGPPHPLPPTAPPYTAVPSNSFDRPW
ncbi:hypothetical protein BXZ70DRAFT_153696 [Cristinia sonorae]|uniref:Uncharacterized protein n=1 Tax=Cristinia sonorae TaxID=1940300 RepID=A0A8K0UQH8_9AGAR|nr:hypothetical protein BXZ70DRAFT_153696 [Cristinia sonorae]